MTKALVSDDFWSIVQPLLPAEPSKFKGGRPRVSDRAALTGILFVLRSRTIDKAARFHKRAAFLFSSLKINKYLSGACPSIEPDDSGGQIDDA